MKLVYSALRLSAASGVNLSQLNARTICTIPARYQRVITTKPYQNSELQYNFKVKDKVKTTDWKHAVSEAEKIVGYPKSFLNLRWIFDDDFANIEYHLKQLVTSTHPLPKVVNCASDNQAWGLVVLLMSKALGYKSEDQAKLDPDTGVLKSQRTLAIVTEMIFFSNMIHQSMVNINPGDFPDTKDLEAMLYGNKTALLSGDFILAKQCMELGTLNNPELVELMSRAERDIIEVEFIGDRDGQNRPLLSAGLTELDWTERTSLAAGSLLAKGCQGTLMLAERGTTEQQSAYSFGYHLALAWQACLELEAISKPAVAGASPFSLTSAPLIFALQHDASILALTDKGRDSVLHVDYEKVIAAVKNGPALEQTKELQCRHARRAFEELHQLADNESSQALASITLALTH